MKFTYNQEDYEKLDKSIKFLEKIAKHEPVDDWSALMFTGAVLNNYNLYKAICSSIPHTKNIPAGYFSYAFNLFKRLDKDKFLNMIDEKAHSDEKTMDKLRKFYFPYLLSFIPLKIYCLSHIFERSFNIFEEQDMLNNLLDHNTDVRSVFGDFAIMVKLVSDTSVPAYIPEKDIDVMNKEDKPIIIIADVSSDQCMNFYGINVQKVFQNKDKYIKNGKLEFSTEKLADLNDVVLSAKQIKTTAKRYFEYYRAKYNMLIFSKICRTLIKEGKYRGQKYIYGDSKSKNILMNIKEQLPETVLIVDKLKTDERNELYAKGLNPVKIYNTLELRKFITECKRKDDKLIIPFETLFSMGKTCR